VFILPVLRAEADRLQSVLEGPLGNNTDRIAADHVRAALLVSITVSHVSACHDVKQSSIPTPLQTFPAIGWGLWIFRVFGPKTSRDLIQKIFGRGSL